MTAEVPRPERLCRLETIFVRSPIYFVTACASRRRKVLATPAIQQSFVKFAKEGPKYGAWIGSYVLMPDHFHLFVAVDDERVSDHLLRSAESYTEKWHYVRENPVRAGLVKRWDDWPFHGEIFVLEYRADD